MVLTLKELTGIQALARFLVDWLPGSGREGWRGHVSFKTIAGKVGVGRFFQLGSKQPMLVALLRGTLENERGSFERLILEIVHSGIAYRGKQGQPVRPEDIDQLNGHLLEVGFKFPDLWDPAIRDSLRVDDSIRARQRVEEATSEAMQKTAQLGAAVRQREAIREEFFRQSQLENRQQAGLALEGILNRLFVCVRRRLETRRSAGLHAGRGSGHEAAHLLDAWRGSLRSRSPLQRAARAPGI